MNEKRCGRPFAVPLLLFCLSAAGVLCYPREASAGISRGIDYSLSILLPSLFPFMFLVSFASKSGAADVVGSRIAGFTRLFLSLPGAAGVTVMLSLIGGYPVGAAGISELLSKKCITPAQARRMLLFCVNPGPAFVINTIGISMLNNEKAGVVILCSNVAAALIIGIAAGLFSTKESVVSESVQIEHSPLSVPGAVIAAVRSACGSCVSLCSLVVLFSGFASVVMTVMPLKNEMCIALIKSFLEVTDGASLLCGINAPIYIVAAATAWGGLCVHMQVMAALPELKVGAVRFFAGRAAASALSAGAAYLICRFVCPDVEVFSNIEHTTAAPSSLAPNGSIMMFVCCVMFMIFISGLQEEKEITL